MMKDDDDVYVICMYTLEACIGNKWTGNLQEWEKLLRVPAKVGSKF